MLKPLRASFGGYGGQFRVRRMGRSQRSLVLAYGRASGAERIEESFGPYAGEIDFAQQDG